MLSTTRVDRGDVFRVRYLFPSQRGIKRRPALAVSSLTYVAGRHEVVLAAITSNTKRLLPGDTLLRDWEVVGLRAASVVTGVLRTIKQSDVEDRIGSLSEEDMRVVEANLRLALGL